MKDLRPFIGRCIIATIIGLPVAIWKTALSLGAFVWCIVAAVCVAMVLPDDWRDE